MPPTTTDRWEDIEAELCSSAREACSCAFDLFADDDAGEPASGETSVVPNVPLA